MSQPWKEGEVSPAGRLKILFITPWFPVEDDSVQGAFIFEHARAVAQSDEVVVLHLRAEADLSSLRSAKLSYETYGGVAVWRCSYPARSRLDTLWRTWATLKAYRRLRKSFKPDVIHGHVYSAAASAVVLRWLTRKPLIVTEHASTFFPGRVESPSRRMRLQARVAWSAAEKVLPVSETLAGSIRSIAPGARVEVIPNVVAAEFFESEREVLTDGVSRIVAVGLLKQGKGYEDLLKALSILATTRSGVELQIIGDGPLREKLASMATEIGLSARVIFRGELSKPVIARVLSSSDVFVSASLFETFSVATAEALASGLPVVVTRSGGPEEFVTPDVGLTVPCQDPPALAEAIEKVLGAPQRFDAATLRAYAAQRFSPSAVGKSLRQVYRSVSK